MPSLDSTGKRLSGGRQRQKAAANNKTRAKLAQLAPDLAAALPEFAAVAGDAAQDDEPHPIPCEEPPAPPDVDALMRWANDVQACAAVMASAGEDPARVRAAGVVVKALCRAKVAAKDSARLALALRKYRGAVVELDGVSPPLEHHARAAWAAWRLAHLLHRVATSPESPDEAAVSHTARAYGLLCEAQDQAAIDTLVSELADDGEDAG